MAGVASLGPLPGWRPDRADDEVPHPVQRGADGGPPLVVAVPARRGVLVVVAVVGAARAVRVVGALRVVGLPAVRLGGRRSPRSEAGVVVRAVLIGLQLLLMVDRGWRLVCLRGWHEGPVALTSTGAARGRVVVAGHGDVAWNGWVKDAWKCQRRIRNCGTRQRVFMFLGSALEW